MAERMKQSDTGNAKEPVASPETTTGPIILSHEERAHTTGALPTLTEQNGQPIIWTPRFIILFALILILGLSIESLLAQLALSYPFSLGWVLLAHTLLILGGWIVLTRRTRSPWLRTGGLFGCAWAFFAGSGYAISALPVDQASANLVHLHAAFATALFGSYICLSINRTLFHRWDNWFFRLAILVGGCAVAIIYLLLPATIRSTRSLEDVATTVLLFFSLFVWWLRPSCWRSMPGATFLFGITPALLLLLAIPGFTDRYSVPFFSQVALLALLLGILRILQGEAVATPAK